MKDRTTQAWFRLGVGFFAILVLAVVLGGESAFAAEDGPRPRIISLYAAHTEVLLRLGARDNIIGVSRQESYDGPESEGWDPPTFSIRDDVEKFLAAKPDILLVRPQHLAGNARLREALESAGIEVRSIQVTRAEGLYPYWRELGGLVGREAEAEKMIADFDRTIERYRAASARRAEKPGVFIEAIHREVKTFTPDSIPAWLVGLAGGRYAAADATAASPGVIIADFGPERLLAEADAIDIFVAQDGAMNRTPLEVVKARDIYQPLKAFRTGRVHVISEARIARPTPSLLLGLAQLAEWTGLVVD